MGERSVNSMRSQAGAAIGRRPLLRFRPRSLTSASLGGVKIPFIKATPNEWVHVNSLAFNAQVQLNISGRAVSDRSMNTLWNIVVYSS